MTKLRARILAIGAGEAAATALGEIARLACFEPGAVIFRPGDPCAGYLLALTGAVRVSLPAASGRELPLYTVGPGDLCLQTFQCLVTQSAYAAEGRAIGLVEAVMISPAQFDALMGDNAEFRQFVLKRVAARFAEIAQLMEAVAAEPMPARLARALLKRGDLLIEATHAELAIEIVSAREVVTRTLGHWRDAGLVSLARGRITIQDRDALSRAVATGLVT